jgi:hypothetical protein
VFDRSDGAARFEVTGGDGRLTVETGDRTVLVHPDAPDREAGDRAFTDAYRHDADGAAVVFAASVAGAREATRPGDHLVLPAGVDDPGWDRFVEKTRVADGERYGVAATRHGVVVSARDTGEGRGRGR